MIKLYICCLVLIIGSVEVGLDIDMKFHQEVMKIVSYDITLKKLKIKNTALAILCKELNTRFLSQTITVPIYHQKSTRDSKTKTYTYLHPPLPKTYVHGTIEAEEEPDISNYTATGCTVKKQGHWKAV